MAIISADYNGSDSYYFSQHDAIVMLKNNVGYNYTGVYYAFSIDVAAAQMLVAGLIYSRGDGIWLTSDNATIDIVSTGVIASANDAIYATSGSGSVTINNFGLLSGRSGISVGNATGEVSIYNGGTIQASAESAYAIFSGSADDRITNAGAIIGIVAAGDGDDVIDTHLGTVNGLIIGSAGDDTYIIGAGQTVREGLYGNYDDGGNDQVISYGDFTLPSFIETLTLAGSATVGRGNAGVNGIFGNDNGNRLFGAGGFDYVSGGSGDDILRGGAGDDVLVSAEGEDRFDGGAGDDLIQVGLDVVRIEGGVGTDVAAFLQNDTAIVADLTLATGAVKGGAAGLDTLVGIEGVWGSAFDDTLTGNAVANTFLGYLGDDIIKGGGGDDIIEGYDGLDQLDGGAGIDTLSFENDSDGIVASLLTNTGTTGAAAGETYVGFENLRGGYGADTLVGSAGANVLQGGAGGDILSAGSGIDTLYGDAGNDQLTGGAAKDLFGFRDVLVDLGTFSPGGFGKDTITDFQDGIDRISFVGDSQVDSLSDLTISQSGSSTIVTVTGTTDQIVLLNFAPANFTSADIIFG